MKYCQDGSYVDLAACGMADSSGIVVVYYHTPAEYVNNYNLSFTHILSGYDDREDGKIVVTKGNQIIASNDDSMVGEDIDKYNVIKKIKETGASGNKCILHISWCCLKNISFRHINIHIIISPTFLKTIIM